MLCAMTFIYLFYCQSKVKSHVKAIETSSDELETLFELTESPEIGGKHSSNDSSRIKGIFQANPEEGLDQDAH